MVAGSAGNDVDAVNQTELLQGHAQLIDGEHAVGQTSCKGVADDTGLLMDFFEHEIGIAALLGNINIPINVHNLGLNGVSISIGIADAVGFHNGKLVVAKDGDVSGGFDDRDDVGCNVAALLAVCKDDGGVFASDDYAAGFLGAYDGKTVGANNL